MGKIRCLGPEIQKIAHKLQMVAHGYSEHASQDLT